MAANDHSFRMGVTQDTGFWGKTAGQISQTASPPEHPFAYAGSKKNGPAGAPTPLMPSLTPSTELNMSIPSDDQTRQKMAVEFLQLSQQKLDLAKYDRLYWIDLARQHGLSWNQIGKALGISDVAARRLHVRAANHVR